MPTSKSSIQTQESVHLNALQAKHSALSMRIEEQQKHPSVSDTSLRKLKAKKLKIKDEIEKQRSK